VLQATGDKVAAELERRMRAVHKVEATDQFDDDEDTDAVRKKARAIVALISLSGLVGLRVEMTTSLTDLYLDTAKLAAGQLGMEWTPDLEATLQAQADDYASARAGDLLTAGGEDSIIDSTRNMVTEEVTKSVVSGGSASDTADAVQEGYAFSEDRADVIANNEAQLANGAGILAVVALAQASGMQLGKYWETAQDDLVEETCLENEAAGVIPFNEPFPSGDEGTPAHPRCRCSIGLALNAENQP
jgi:hypothetical protein